jgi:hypothetical protein
MRGVLVGALILGAAGCDETTAVVCTEEARPALSVTVRDLTTGTSVGGDTRVIARDSAYADTADVAFLGMVYSLAYERPGTYEVLVLNPAYDTWRQAGVRVTADQCHVQTVSIVARLVPKE